MHHYFNVCLSTALYITQQCIQIIIIVTVHPSLLQCLLVHSIIYYTAVHTNNYNCYSASLLQCLLVHSIIYYTAVHTNNYNCYSASLLQCCLSTALYITQQCIQIIIIVTVHHYFNVCLSTALYITQQCIQIIIIVTVHHYFNACLSTALYITQQCIQIIIIVTVHPSLLQCLLVHSIIYYTAVHTNNYNCYSASFITSMFACPQHYILHSSAYK